MAKKLSLPDWQKGALVAAFSFPVGYLLLAFMGIVPFDGTAIFIGMFGAAAWGAFSGRQIEED